MQELRDASMKITKALPNGAATATSAAVDLGENTGLRNNALDVDFLLSAPVLNTTQQPDAKTMKYNIVYADDAALSTNKVTYITTALTQTGAGGAGAAAATFRFRLPSTAKRYVGFEAVGSASGDATGASATLEVLF